MREQGVVLEDGVDVSGVRRGVGDILIAEEDPSGGGCLEPRDHSQHGGLARSGRPEHGEELAILDGQIHPVDGPD